VPPIAVRERLIFSVAVKRMRLQRGLTQQKVAAEGDLGRKYLSQLECGHVTPTLPSMAGISKGFGMPLAEFFREVAEAFAAAEDAATSERRRPSPAG
jgi:transcriptional regulator with XRE-family HTH domain